MDIPQNVRSARLIKVVKAATLTARDLPSDTIKALNDGARAVRLLIEADSPGAAQEALTALDLLQREALDGDTKIGKAVDLVINGLRQVLP